MVFDTTTRALEAWLNTIGADVTIVCTFKEQRDKATDTEREFTQITLTSLATSGTAVTIVSAPTTLNTSRKLTYINVFAASPRTVELQIDDNGSNRRLKSISLATAEAWEWTPEAGPSRT